MLHAEAVNLAELADAVGTPFYCYSSATIERHYNVFAGAFADVDALVCYALKANSNQAVVTTLARLGAGDLETLDLLITAGIASSRAEGVRWALARLRERPAYEQLRARTREIEDLKSQF